MVTKTIWIEFADRRIRAIDHIFDIQKAVDNARLNLFSRFDIRIQNTHITEDDRFIVEMNVPEELSDDFNAGRRLRGISKYLLNEHLFGNRYQAYRVGKRLLNYNEVITSSQDGKALSREDSINAIISFAELLEYGGEEHLEYINKILNILNEAKQHFTVGRAKR